MKLPIPQYRRMRICLCGNDDDHKGFYSCDVNGNPVDPEKQHKPYFTACGQCGRIFNDETGEYIDARLDNPRTQMERKAVLVQKLVDTEIENWSRRYAEECVTAISSRLMGQLTEKEIKQVVQHGFLNVMRKRSSLRTKIWEILEFRCASTLVGSFWLA